ncbi:MAG: SMC family ATPase [Clostridia bacterium]|nr:SMC family ATPase [Clostridia bacterium]
MKPVYLEFSGINSFSEKAVVDFKRLLSGGLFGIFGDTGSGKSTILDAIHLALYGKIERAAGSISDCINYNSDRAYVVYDFEIVENGKRNAYRVQRERRRKNLGVKAYLYRYEESGLFALADGTDEVDGKLREIIGLDFDDFKKCIALPQGEFAGLVQSTNKDRVTLVSRLFDLEKYGEKLGFSIRSGCDKIVAEARTLEARMDENGGGRVENIQAKEGEIKEMQAELSALETRLVSVKKDRETLSALALEKKEYDELTQKLKTAEAEVAYYEKQRADLERAEQATRIKETQESLNATRKEKAETAQKAEAADKRAAEKFTRAETLKKAIEEADFEAQIEKKTVALSKVEGAKRDFENCREIKENLDRCTEEYKKLKDKHPTEDFDGLLKEIEKKLSALGADLSFAEYLKNGLKPVLVAETYEEVRFDLKTLGEKYPQTREDIDALVEKYTLEKEDRFDLATARRTFDELKTQSERLKNEKKKIEERKSAYEKNEAEKARIIEDGKHYRKLYEEQKEKISALAELGSEADLKTELSRLKERKRSLETALKTAEEEYRADRTEAEKNRAVCLALEKRERTEQTQLQTLVENCGFASAEEALALLFALGDRQAAKIKCETFFNDYRMIKGRLLNIDGKKFESFSWETLETKKAEERALDNARVRVNGELAVKKAELEGLKTLREKYLELQKQLDEKRKKQALWEQLRSLTAKNKFMEFIASEYLQDICLSASKTLLSLTGGRYFLRYDKEFKAGDNLNGGILRAVKTLSGGETFLVSLSLALSLSGAIFSKSLRPIEFFFLDEGFGTLDDKLVDTVMDVLSKLSQNFAVGLISHVEELKRRIDNKILVTAANETHGSQISIETF